MAPSSVKLYYFDGRGRAEPIRWLLALVGWKYEDIRVQQSDFPALKPKTPYGSLPYIVVDGHELCQSLPIANYLAKEGGLLGSNNFEAAQCEMIAANIADAFNELGSALLASDQAVKEAGMDKLLHVTLPKLFTFVMKYKNNNKYIVGNKFTLADVAVAAFIDNFDDKVRGEINKHFPDIISLYNAVIAQPRIASWVQQRPKTAF